MASTHLLLAILLLLCLSPLSAPVPSTLALLLLLTSVHTTASAAAPRSCPPPPLTARRTSSLLPRRRGPRLPGNSPSLPAIPFQRCSWDRRHDPVAAIEDSDHHGHPAGYPGCHSARAATHRVSRGPSMRATRCLPTIEAGALAIAAQTLPGRERTAATCRSNADGASQNPGGNVLSLPPFSLCVFLFPSLLDFLSFSGRDTYPSLSVNSSHV